MRDIQPGDVVVCVPRTDDCIPRFKSTLKGVLKIGKMYRVERVVSNRSWAYRGIVVSGAYSDHSTKSWCETRFRKVRPADPEFVERIARIKVGEPA